EFEYFQRPADAHEVVGVELCGACGIDALELLVEAAPTVGRDQRAVPLTDRRGGGRSRRRAVDQRAHKQEAATTDDRYLAASPDLRELRLRQLSPAGGIEGLHGFAAVDRVVRRSR